MVNLVLGLIFAGLFFASYQTDRRRLRNGVLLVVAVWLLVQALLELLISLNPWFEWLSLLVLLGPPLCAFVFAGFLIANGVTMVRREGRGISSLLPFAVGLAVFMAPVVAFLFVISGQPVLAGLAAFAFFLCSYLGCAFVVFLGYAIVYSKLKFNPNPAAIIILGSGLIDGKVPPLLASRLNRALEIYDGATLGRPVLVPSGGQGADEPRPESTAMKEYLVSQGAGADDVVEEDRATTTRENLDYSAALLAGRGIHGPLLVCTNNYHVLRAALLTRRARLNAEVVGAPTASYFVPSAFLREFVAVMRDNRLTNILMGLPMLGVAVLITVALMNSPVV
ncbi:YdcF family protein [Pseudarthrobacter sp. J64]|uniref:YdcF family protein n=1 Tax=Pseudarthrobacter sp. J64 TaxID=3116485 RepID=UPI002E803E13|nr:YdcF family protein [Pseudarthrobacter sp. J64]MEE2571064.1 YdcF family protein [Pseudarthrobacter sp. J64]